MQVLAVKDRADHDAPGFGVGAEVPRQKRDGTGVGGLGSLRQSPGVIRQLFDGAQRLPHVCRQTVDEGPPLGEELRRVAAGVVLRGPTQIQDRGTNAASSLRSPYRRLTAQVAYVAHGRWVQEPAGAWQARSSKRKPSSVAAV